MELEHRHGHFRLEITSLEEFATFIAIIRAEELDTEQAHALLVRLNTKSAALKAAVKGADHGQSDT